MLRLIIAAVLVSACLAFPQRRDGAPADMTNLKAFDPAAQGFQGGMAALMPNMQSMQGNMGPGQFLPYNPNFGFTIKRGAEENLEKRKHHSKFNENNKASFDTSSSQANFDFNSFLKENPDSIPFGNIENTDTADLGNFVPNDEQGLAKDQFRFFDKQQ
uniref:Conotoxin B2 superfamily protein n=2 Tax=Conus TaxID=6490 RepID=A0AA49XA04_CONMO|nr:conotoxin precursor B2 superfamily protein [Conus monile]